MERLSNQRLYLESQENLEHSKAILDEYWNIQKQKEQRKRK